MQHHMARFRVLGIIGKGAFSTVIKCVEEGTDIDVNTNVHAGVSGRIVAYVTTGHGKGHGEGDPNITYIMPPV